MKNLLQQLERLGPVIPGTIRKVFLRCGRKNCACTSGKVEDKHGPYYFWAYKNKGKLTSVSLDESELKDFEKWIENRRKLESIVEKILIKGIDEAQKKRKIK